MTAGVPLSTIRVGARLDPKRAEQGIAELADSIRERGLILPLAVTPDRRVLDGGRRRAALELLAAQGHEIPVPVRVVATAKTEEEQEAVEWDANEHALPWSLEARWEHFRRCKAREQADARERMAEGGRRKGGPADPPLKAGRAEENAAKAAGLSRSTARRLDAIMTAAAENPELAPLRDEVVSGGQGKVNAVFRKLQRAQAAGGRIHDKDSYCTPAWPLDAVRRVDPVIALDPCSNATAIALGHVRALVAWTIDDDALVQPTWLVVEVAGRYVVWFQPPYSGPLALTQRLVDEWDAGHFDRVYALVKLDTSTDWWALLRERAAVVILPRDRIDHEIGVGEDGCPIAVAESDICSALLVLARGTRAELLQLWRDLIAAFGDQADVYLSPNVLEVDRQATATPNPTTPATATECR